MSVKIQVGEFAKAFDGVDLTISKQFADYILNTLPYSRIVKSNDADHCFYSFGVPCKDTTSIKSPEYVGGHGSELAMTGIILMDGITPEEEERITKFCYGDINDGDWLINKELLAEYRKEISDRILFIGDLQMCVGPMIFVHRDENNQIDGITISNEHSEDPENFG